MISAVTLILISFVSTNIDELCILILFFSLAVTKTEARNIVIGEYLGVGAAVAISLTGTLGLSVFIDKYQGLLGFIPICLGIKTYINLWKRHKISLVKETTATENAYIPTVLKVFLVILADSGDSIGIYISVFSNFDLIRIFITIIVFVVLIAFWCYLSFRLSNLRVISKNIKRFKHVFVPIFLILLGILILFNDFYLKC